jgi:hypothetical protein
MHVVTMPNEPFNCDECSKPAKPYVAVGANNGLGGSHMVRLCRACAWTALDMLDQTIAARRAAELAEWEAHR